MEYDCHIFSKYRVFRMKNLVFQPTYLVFRKSGVFSGLYVCPIALASVVPTDTYILSKYYTSAQLDQQQKHSAPFANSFSNPTGESVGVMYK